MKTVKQVFEFEWDTGNIDKNRKHGVEDREGEEAFLDEGRVIYKDNFHSKNEERFILLGKTDKDRLLYIAFTYRGKKIRIISARDINKKEVDLYEEKAKKNAKEALEIVLAEVKKAGQLDEFLKEAGFSVHKPVLFPKVSFEPFVFNS